MRIGSSFVELSSTRSFQRTEASATSLRLSVGRPAEQPRERLAAPVDRQREGPPLHAPAHGWRGTLPGVGSVPAHAAARAPLGRPVDAEAPAAASRAEAAEEGTDADGLTANLRVAIAIVERLTGRRVQVLHSDDLAGGGTEAPATHDGQDAAPANDDAARAGPAWSISLDHSHRVEEHERTAVSARATVTTDTGEQREVSLELRMSRSFVEEHLVSVRLAGGGEPVDPLVVTLEPGMATFGADTASFDLDLDGADDTVRLTGGASAYLVDDLDGDGAISDGRELFGPSTGDGFAELAAHDTDGNRWLDAGDAAFHRLRLATSDHHGGVRLRTLSEAGVGAIGLASVASPFLVADGGAGIAQVRSTGMVLMDDGSAGTVQHVDLLL